MLSLGLIHLPETYEEQHKLDSHHLTNVCTVMAKAQAEVFKLKIELKALPEDAAHEEMRIRTQAEIENLEAWMDRRRNEVEVLN